MYNNSQFKAKAPEKKNENIMTEVMAKLFSKVLWVFTMTINNQNKMAEAGASVYVLRPCCLSLNTV